MIKKLYDLKKLQIDQKLIEKSLHMAGIHTLEDEMAFTNNQIVATTVNKDGAIRDFAILQIHKDTMKLHVIKLEKEKKDLENKLESLLNVIVELQKAKQNYFKDRTVYYSTFPIQSQAQTGEWDFKLKAVYCIGILDFVFDKNDQKKETIHTIELKNQHNQVFYDKLKYIYLEMPNFNLSLEQLETHQDRWLFFIKNLANLHEIPELFKDDIIYQGFETAKIAALNKTEQAIYQQSLKDYRDLYNVVNTSHKEGFEEGREQGIEEGEYNRAINTAINLKALNSLSEQQIAEATGLPVETIKNLTAD